MAKQGNFAALQRLQPTEGLSQDIQYWNNDARQRRQEQRIEDDIQYNREQAKIKDQRELFDKYFTPYEPVTTGIDSYDEAAMGALALGQEKMAEQADILSKAEPGSKEFIKASLRLASLNNIPEILVSSAQKLAASLSAYRNDLENDTAWEDPNIEIIQANQFKSLKFGLDDNYNLMVAYYDPDGVGENSILGIETPQTILNKENLFDYDRKYDMTLFAQELAKNIGKSLDDNFTESNIKRDQAKIEAIRLNARKLIYDEGEKISKIGKSFLRETGIQDPEELVKYFENMTEGFTDTSVTKNKPTTTTTKSGDKEDKNQPRLSEGVIPTKQTWGDEYESIKEGGYLSSNIFNDVIIPALRKGTETITDAKVENITYNKDKQMVVDVVYQDSKSTTYEKEKEGLVQMLERLENEKAKAENDKNKALASGNAALAEEKEALSRAKEEEYKKYNLDLKRLTLGNQNKRTVVVVPNEDESKVASYFPGGLQAIRTVTGLIKSEGGQQQEQQQEEQQETLAEKMRRRASENK